MKSRRVLASVESAEHPQQGRPFAPCHQTLCCGPCCCIRHGFPIDSYSWASGRVENKSVTRLQQLHADLLVEVLGPVQDLFEALAGVEQGHAATCSAP